MDDPDLRAAVARMAKLVARLAAAEATSCSHEVDESDGYRVMNVFRHGQDRLEARWEMEATRLVGTDAEGPIAIAIDVDGSYAHHLAPNIDDLNAVIGKAGAAMAVTKPLAGGADVTIPLACEDQWRAMAATMEALTGSHPDLDVRLWSHRKGAQLDIVAKGVLGHSGPSSALAAAVAALPPAPFLTWRRAMSPQALAKRRQNHLPPMGIARIAPAVLTRKADVRRPSVDGGASLVVRPSIAVTRLPDVPVAADARFEWTIPNWEEASFFGKVRRDLQPVLVRVLVATTDMLEQAPEYARRSNRWTQVGARNGQAHTISYEDAKILVDAEIMERSGDRLRPTRLYQILLEGLAATGHRTWEGVRTLARVEHVPSGIAPVPGRYGGSAGGHTPNRAVARLSDEGFEIIPYLRPGDTPTLARAAYARLRITPDQPVIAVRTLNGVAWPDHERDVRAEIEGRIGVPCDPELDHRGLPGPMGALYRMPEADRLLVQRYLHQASMPHWTPEFHDWRWDLQE